MRFIDGVAKLIKCDLKDILSPRVVGLAHKLYLEKKPLLQKDPMPANAIEKLERLIVKKKDPVQAVILGQLIFCYHPGARWSDSSNLRKMELQVQGDVSFLVGESLSSKTTRAKEAKTRFLPFVAIGTGLSGNDWGTAWINASKGQFVEDQFPFLPSFSCRSGTWSSQPMGSSEAMMYLEDFLDEVEVPVASFTSLGTHSLKAGFLTLASRSTPVVFTPEERRLLGHHVDPGAKSVLTYSREAYTTLYGKVLAMFRSFRAADFDPDSSAVDRVIQTAAAWDRADVRLEEQDPNELSDSSEEEGEPLLGGLSGGSSPPRQARGMFPNIDQQDVVVHKKSGIAHCLLDSHTTVCGRHISPNYGPIELFEEYDLECCLQWNCRQKSRQSSLLFHL